MKIRICSWDVGILNLAYCIIEKDLDTNTCTIIDWNVIDLTNKTENKKTCGGKLKNGKICGKKAVLFRTENDDNIYYCNTHSKQYKVPDQNTVREQVMNHIGGKQSCGFSDKCKKNASFISNDGLLYCKGHSESIVKSLIKAKQLNKIKKINATDINLQILSNNICTKIDAINNTNNIYDVDEVLIEHQPVLKNPTIKSIGCFIFHHFVVRCKKPNTKIKFISASNKLKITDDKLTNMVNVLDDNDKLVKLINKTIKDHLGITTDQNIQITLNGISDDNYKNVLKYIIQFMLSKKVKMDDINMMPGIKKTMDKNNVIKLLDHIKDKIGYSINKLLAVKYSNTLLTKEWLEYLNNHTKKDDLCDAYLQGYHYINK